MTDASIGGITLMVLVIGLVEFAKKLGLQGNTSIVAAAVLGLLFGVVYKVMPIMPETYAFWVEAVVYGIAFGLSACGLYDVAKRFTGNGH